MKKFLNDYLKNLEINASFFPSMKQTTPHIIPPLKIFGYLHPKIEIQVELNFPTICEPSSSNLVGNQPFYVKKVTNTPKNIEETYGEGFTILRKDVIQ
jgi:hypothetical protein